MQVTVDITETDWPHLWIDAMSFDQVWEPQIHAGRFGLVGGNLAPQRHWTCIYFFDSYVALLLATAYLDAREYPYEALTDEDGDYALVTNYTDATTRHLGHT